MARLPQGVIKRKNGTLQKRFTIDGKRYSVYGHTTEELLHKEAEKRKLLACGIVVDKSTITLEQYFSEFVNQRKNYIKGNSLHNYKSLYSNHIAPVLGSKKLIRIDRRECLNFQSQLKNNGLSYSLVNSVMNVLRIILNNAVTDELIIKNPITGIKPLKDTKKVAATETKHRALTLEEQSKFMQQLKDNNAWYYELIALLLTTGLRVGEALALQWCDIDYKNRVLHVTKTQSNDINGKMTINTPKTATSKRDIPMNDTIVNLLKDQWKKYQLLLTSGIMISDNRVFFTPYGLHPRNAQVNRDIIHARNQLVKQGVAIDYFTAHALRDTFATRYIEQGGTPQTLKTILGHSNLSMTMDLYAHVLPNTKAEEMNRITIVV